MTNAMQRAIPPVAPAPSSTAPPPRTRPRVWTLICTVLFVACGLAALGGGVWLASLGGSVYYVPAGACLIATGLLLRTRPAPALLLHALCIVGTVAWAFREGGLDWWPYAARVDLPFVLGVLLLVAWAIERRHAASMRAAAPAATALFVVLAIAATCGSLAKTRDTHRVRGTLPAAAERPAAAAASDPVPADEWQAYGRTGDGQRYSPLADLTPTNVRGLEVAWQFRTGDVRGRSGDPEETTDEVTPLKIGTRLFLCTPHQSVIALDATTGRQLWRYDPQIETGLALQHMTCRGLSYRRPHGGAVPAVAEAASAAASASSRALPIAASGTTKQIDCDAKLYLPTADGRLIALDPASGAVCRNFGAGSGQIDLWQHMPNVQPGAYYSTSPVVVTDRLVVVGGTVLDNYSTREQSGVIRAYDADTGTLVWNWDSGRPDATAPLAGNATYVQNSPNSWAPMSVDETLGLVYAPMGNQPPD